MRMNKKKEKRKETWGIVKNKELEDLDDREQKIESELKR